MADVRLESPLFNVKGGMWLKGNLHTHTSRSDGRSDPQEMARAYAKMGHDFLMLSDHDILGEPEKLDGCGMVLLNGSEVSNNGPHLLDVGARRRVEPRHDRQIAIRSIKRTSGFAVLCHPNWTEDFNHWRFETLLGLADYAGIEIFNGFGLDLPGSHLALDKWDRLLAEGRMLWGYANDDAHRVEQIGRGWNVVLVAKRTKEAILDALRTGCFYASSGVAIESIAAEGSTLVVRAPEAEAIEVYAPYGKRVARTNGPEMRFDASNVFAPFIRVECIGRAGAMAWTQPILLRGGPFEDRQKRFAKLAGKSKPTLKMLRAARAPKFTGRLDDPLWAKARPSSAFLRIDDGQKPAVKTEVRAIVTATHLYLGARCEEPELDKMRLRINADDDGGMWADDSVEFFFVVGQTFVSDHRGWQTGMSALPEYFQIIVNANGFVYGTDALTGRTLTGKIHAKSDRYEGGWTLELAIPLKALGGSTKRGKQWGFHVCRNRSGVGGTFVWSWVGTSNHSPARFGRLAF